jgi:urease accessory protein
MRRATRVIAKGDWKPDEAKGTVTLSFEDRFRRRVLMTDDAGEAFMLDLAHATRFEDGDGLALAEGGMLLVRAAIEDVLDVHGVDAQHTSRLAWHIGNRHTPMEVMSEGGLRIRYDHVLAHMLEHLGATVLRASATFAPEAGAYDSPETGEGSHGHSHAHSHHG